MIKMTMKKIILIMCGFFLIWSTTAHASSIKIWPLKIMLSPAQNSDSVRLRNNGTQLVNVQISAKTWDMDENGQFIETDSGDFVFFPRLLTLPPGEEKSVRVGYHGDFPPLEKSYRLYIEELPPILTPEEQALSIGVQYTLKLSLPLFVMPGKTAIVPNIGIEALQRSDTGLKFALRAVGNYHLSVRQVNAELFDATGTSLTKGENKPRLMRILPQRRVFMTIPLDIQLCTQATHVSIQVEAEGLKAPYTQRLELVTGQCRLENN
jgi:fimbrial chaperone protein